MIATITSRLKFEANVIPHLLRSNLWNLASVSPVKRALDAGCLHHRVVPGPLANDPFISNPGLDAHYLEKPIEEYVYRIAGPVTIEPDFGFVLLHPAHVMYKSLPYSEFGLRHNTIKNFAGLPNLTKFLLAKGRTVPVRREKSVINLHYIYDYNYYHGHQDILAKLGMFDQFGVDEQVPIVISRRAAETRLFQGVMQSGKLRKRQWIVQDQFYIEADEVIFGKTSEGNRSRLDYMLDQLEAPRADPASRRRVYLQRKKQSGRNLTNAAEILDIISDYGFEIVYTDDMTFHDQMKLFSETEYLISAHGAGLVNIIYRRNAPMRLLELFPSAYVMMHYYLLCRMFGFQYDYLIGPSEESGALNPNFTIDAASLKEKLAQWFS
jgi:hypothetical protein